MSQSDPGLSSPRALEPYNHADAPFGSMLAERSFKSAEYVEVGRFNHSGFVAEEEVDGGAGEVPVAADFVLEVTAVWFLYPIGRLQKNMNVGT